MKDEEYLDCARTELLPGVNLVEASAGTGKTYAIAMLVLRCVTELGVSVDSILVVTFTKAATEELRSRIRQRLVEARNLLAGGTSDDATISSWVATVIDRDLAQKRLQQALFDIDRAAIFTIHSFCQRMLTEQALESGQLFDVELLADVEQVRTQVVEDYWRRRMYTMQPLVCGLVVQHFPNPQALYSSVARAGAEYSRLDPETVPIGNAIEQFQDSYAKIALWWSQYSTDLHTSFQQALTEGKLKKQLSESFADWWNSLAGYFTGEGATLPDNLAFLSHEGVKEALNGNRVRKDKQDAFLAEWPLPDELITHFRGAADALVLALRRDLLVHIREELELRLYSEGHMSFDDLIVRLDRALLSSEDGLQKILSERFSVALIDEFQDTDSAQWRIFSTLFARGSHYLYLIGDPKQAIYRFRGADIYSYFTAKERADRQLTLQNNYRSHPFLVHEVNRIFQSSRNPFAFDERLMSFTPVQPAKAIDDGELYRNGQALGVMEYCHLSSYPKDSNGRWTSGKAAERFREYVISEVCHLLDRDNPVLCRQIKNGEVSETALQARDVAVLVRSNRQADEYLQSFARAGIPAVVGSKKGVFETEEGAELLTLLQALAAPGDVYRLKRAMTISWFSFSGNQLLAIWQDDAVFDGWFNRFLLYYQLWQDRGFLSMMNRLLVDEEVYVTLAGAPMAERRIANIHHLLELLQEAETTEKFGPGQTLLWLRSMIAGKPGAEDRELRLESDEQAVRIVTMHSAKGLQYPVVFCPYLWYRSGGLAQEKHLISCHDVENNLIIDLGSPEFAERRKIAQDEELAEDLRLLYVALTRAQLRCYTMWVDVKNSGKVASSFDSALGYLLFQEGPTKYEEQCQKLQFLAESPGVHHRVLKFEETFPAVYAPRLDAVHDLTSLAPGSRSLHTDYQMSSYSAMASLSEHEDHGSDSVVNEEYQDKGPEIHHPGLPAGANFGNLIHDALELLPFPSLGAQEDNSREIGRLCRRYGIEVEVLTVQELLATIVSTRLVPGPDGFSLAELDEQRCLSEMPFYFHISWLETKKINEILAGEATVVPLSHKVMQGYLTGFVDLVCEHNGRYFILDYKTNFLGNHLNDYHGDKLVTAMASHNYGLQYWIYTLVLHRHLQNVLPHYSYDHHFGGVLYLFVRGMVPAASGSGVFFTLPSAELLARLDSAVGGEI